MTLLLKLKYLELYSLFNPFGHFSICGRPQGLKPCRTWKGTKFLQEVKSAYATIKTRDKMKMSFIRDGFGYLTSVNPIQF